MTPHSSFSPGPTFRIGRELTHAESAALIRQERRARTLVVSAASCVAVALIAYGTIERERSPSAFEAALAAVPAPPPASPGLPATAPPMVPDYQPTGVDAEWKQQGAFGITQANATLKAAELEGALDAAIKSVTAQKAARERLVLKAKAAERARRQRAALAASGFGLGALQRYHR